jgi:hypothetical protein
VDTITTTGNIDVGGLILAPNQVSFKATYLEDFTSDINTTIILPYNSIDYNIGNGYDDTNYTFTAPITGAYCSGAGSAAPRSTKFYYLLVS